MLTIDPAGDAPDCRSRRLRDEMPTAASGRRATDFRSGRVVGYHRPSGPRPRM